MRAPLATRSDQARRLRRRRRAVHGDRAPTRRARHRHHARRRPRRTDAPPRRGRRSAERTGSARPAPPAVSLRADIRETARAIVASREREAGWNSRGFTPRRGAGAGRTRRVMESTAPSAPSAPTGTRPRRAEAPTRVRTLTGQKVEVGQRAHVERDRREDQLREAFAVHHSQRARGAAGGGRVEDEQRGRRRRRRGIVRRTRRTRRRRRPVDRERGGARWTLCSARFDRRPVPSDDDDDATDATDGRRAGASTRPPVCSGTACPVDGDSRLDRAIARAR